MEPCYKGHPIWWPLKTGLSWGGKINMICEEWCMDIWPNFATLVRLSWPFQRGSTVLSIADLLSIETLWTNFSEISIKNTITFIQENAFQNVVCKMVPIWLQSPCYSKSNQQLKKTCCQTFNISRTLVDNKLADHSDVVGASPVSLRCSNYIFILDLTPGLTLKHRETHGCVVSTVATDALVLKHQAISIHNAD